MHWRKSQLYLSEKERKKGNHKSYLLFTILLSHSMSQSMSITHAKLYDFETKDCIVFECQQLVEPMMLIHSNLNMHVTYQS